MAERQARIKLVIDNTQGKRALDEVESSINKLEKQTTQFGRVASQLFAFAGIGIAVRQFVSLADQFTTIQNRLRTVTSSNQELAAVTEQLGRIANTTRTSFEGTAEIYARVGLAAKDLGVSQQRLLQFTESVNQAVALSGASGTEAQAGLIQLSQGLASGALRGDELHSVLEQLPVVADVIAKQLGVTRGELRQLGQDGKITADIVLDAFASARQELADRFGKSVPTVSQAFTVLRNNLIQGAGAFNEATGATATLAQAIQALGNSVDDVGRFLTSMFQTPLAGAVAFIAVIEKVPQRLVEVFQEAFGQISQNTERSINNLIRGVNAVLSGNRFGFVKLPEFNINTIDAEKAVTGAATDLGKVFREAFAAAIAPPGGEGPEVALGRATGAGRGALPGIEALLNQGSELPRRVGSGPESLFGPLGADLSGLTDQIDRFTGRIEEMPDLVGNAQDAFNPLFDTIATGFQAAEDQLVSFVTTGKVSFADLANSVLESITRVLFRRGAASFLRAVGGGDLAADLFPGFARGGSFIVGGSGGTDSQIVGLRATPGERVTVQTPAQQQQAVPTPVNVRVINQLDPSLALDALATNAGERVIMNVIQRNPHTIRRVLGGGL